MRTLILLVHIFFDGFAFCTIDGLEYMAIDSPLEHKFNFTPSFPYKRGVGYMLKNLIKEKNFS